MRSKIISLNANIQLNQWENTIQYIHNYIHNKEENIPPNILANLREINRRVKFLSRLRFSTTIFTKYESSERYKEAVELLETLKLRIRFILANKSNTSRDQETEILKNICELLLNIQNTHLKNTVISSREHASIHFQIALLNLFNTLVFSITTQDTQYSLDMFNKFLQNSLFDTSSTADCYNRSIIRTLSILYATMPEKALEILDRKLDIMLANLKDPNSNHEQQQADKIFLANLYALLFKQFSIFRKEISLDKKKELQEELTLTESVLFTSIPSKQYEKMLFLAKQLIK
jgi:hypothetical protein